MFVRCGQKLGDEMAKIYVCNANERVKIVFCTRWKFIFNNEKKKMKIVTRN